MMNFADTVPVEIRDFALVRSMKQKRPAVTVGRFHVDRSQECRIDVHRLFLDTHLKGVTRPSSEETRDSA